MLEGIEQPVDGRVLVGGKSFDDAGVLQVSESLALVQSVDFFTPVVDEPFDFGRVAAANALSDIYAMGAEPLSALAVCAFPKGTLPLSVLHDTLAGGCALLAQEGVVLLGGHTVKGPEFTYGLAVTGTVHPAQVLTNAGARPGDLLVLTKALGTGVLSTGLKKGWLAEVARQELLASMVTTNRAGAQACRAVGVHALTDVTGYGLLGHALEMAEASGVAVRIRGSSLPLLPAAREAVQAGMIPGGLVANREWVARRMELHGVAEETIALACDPQTSGGLLAAVAPADAPRLVAEAARRGVRATVVGEVVAGVPGSGVLLP